MRSRFSSTAIAAGCVALASLGLAPGVGVALERTVIARSGTPMLGFREDLVSRDFAPIRWTDAGELLYAGTAFDAALGAEVLGVYRWSETNGSALVLAFDGGPPYGGPTRVAASRSGDMAFAPSVPNVTCAESQANELWHVDPAGGATQLWAAGDPAPGASGLLFARSLAWVLYDREFWPIPSEDGPLLVQETGAIAFGAVLSPDGCVTDSPDERDALYVVEPNGAMHLVALEGAHAGGAAPGVHYQRFEWRKNSLGADGTWTFWAELMDDELGFSYGHGVFRWDPATGVSLVELIPNAAPITAALSSPVLLADGTVAYVKRVTDYAMNGGVELDVSVQAADAGGVHRVLGRGDVLPDGGGTVAYFLSDLTAGGDAVALEVQVEPSLDPFPPLDSEQWALVTVDGAGTKTTRLRVGDPVPPHPGWAGWTFSWLLEPIDLRGDGAMLVQTFLDPGGQSRPLVAFAFAPDDASHASAQPLDIPRWSMVSSDWSSYAFAVAPAGTFQTLWGAELYAAPVPEPAAVEAGLVAILALAAARMRDTRRRSAA